VLAVRKLAAQLRLMHYLLGIEALVAAQAADLRQPGQLGVGSAAVHAQVRQAVAPLQQDRPPGRDAMAVAQALHGDDLYACLRLIAVHGSQGRMLAGLG